MKVKQWLFCLLLMAPAVFAINQAKDITVTPGAGGLFFATKRHIENTSVPFLTIGYNFTNKIGIEGLLGTFNTEYKKAIPIDRQINGTLFNVNGIYHFSPLYSAHLQPFATAGVGILGMSPNYTNAANEGNINASVGLQIFASSIVALRLEARDLYTIVGGKNDVLLSGGVTFLIR